MYEPYKVKKGFFPSITYEETPIIFYNCFTFLGNVKRDCQLLNAAYINGVCSACALVGEQGSQILEEFITHKE